MNAALPAVQGVKQPMKIYYNLSVSALREIAFEKGLTFYFHPTQAIFFFYGVQVGEIDFRPIPGLYFYKSTLMAKPVDKNQTNLHKEISRFIDEFNLPSPNQLEVVTSVGPVQKGFTTVD